MILYKELHIGSQLTDCTGLSMLPLALLFTSAQLIAKWSSLSCCHGIMCHLHRKAELYLNDTTAAILKPYVQGLLQLLQAHGVYEGTYWELLANIGELTEALTQMAVGPAVLEEPILRLPAAPTLPSWELFKPVLQPLPPLPQVYLLCCAAPPCPCLSCPVLPRPALPCPVNLSLPWRPLA